MKVANKKLKRSKEKGKGENALGSHLEKIFPARGVYVLYAKGHQTWTSKCVWVGGRMIELYKIYRLL